MSPYAESRLRHGSGMDDVQSDDGGYGRRGEVELQDLGILGRGMQRRPSMPELVSHAGDKGGARHCPFPLRGLTVAHAMRDTQVTVCLLVPARG